MLHFPSSTGLPPLLSPTGLPLPSSTGLHSSLSTLSHWSYISPLYPLLTYTNPLALFYLSLSPSQPSPFSPLSPISHRSSHLPLVFSPLSPLPFSRLSPLHLYHWYHSILSLSLSGFTHSHFSSPIYFHASIAFASIMYIHCISLANTIL